MSAQGWRAAPTDPDLATIVNAPDQLREAFRAGIITMVKAASGMRSDHAPGVTALRLSDV